MVALRQWFASFLVAGAAFVVVAFALAPLVLTVVGAVLGTEAYKFGAVLGFLGGLAFVWAGSLPAAPEQRFPVALVLFLIGAGGAWFLTRGAVRDVSPYYGWFELAWTYLGGGLGTILALWGSPARRGAVLAAGELLPLLVLSVGVVIALQRPQFGRLGYVHAAPGERTGIRWLSNGESGSNRRLFAWSDPGDASWATDGRGWVETDVGSGPTCASVAPVQTEAIRGAAEEQASQEMRDRVQAEIVDASLPRFLGTLPLPRADLSNATIFQIRDGQAETCGTPPRM